MILGVSSIDAGARTLAVSESRRRVILLCTPTVNKPWGQILLFLFFLGNAATIGHRGEKDFRATVTSFLL